MKMGKTAFIIGGTGQIGIAIAERLLDEGWQVTLGSRGNGTIPSGLLDLGAVTKSIDRSSPEALSASVGGGCDLLVDTIAFDDEHARQLLGIQDDCGQIIAISSASVYCDDEGRTLDEAFQNGFPELPLAMTENQETIDPGPQTYSTKKVAMERELLDGATVPAAIIRPCAIHGPYSSHPREWWFVKRLLDGRPAIPLAYYGRSLFQTSATTNIASLVWAIARSDEAGVFNSADPDSPNISEIGAAIMANCNRKAELVPVEDNGYPPSMGATPWSIPSPFTISGAKALGIGYQPVGDYTTTVTSACDYLMQHSNDDWKNAYPQLAAYPYDMFDYQAEDRWLAMSASKTA